MFKILIINFFIIITVYSVDDSFFSSFGKSERYFLEKNSGIKIKKRNNRLSYRKKWFGIEDVKGDYYFRDGEFIQLLLKFPKGYDFLEVLSKIESELGKSIKNFSGDEESYYWVKNGILYLLTSHKGRHIMRANLAELGKFRQGELGKNIDNLYIIDMLEGKVEEGINSKISLLGERFSKESEFIEKFYILIEDENEYKDFIEFENSGGYTPYIKLYDFNDDGIDEIFVSSKSGTNREIAKSYIYSYKEKKVLSDFDKAIQKNIDNWKIEE